MVKFENPFFSVKGQLERLSNAGKTIVAAVTGKGVKADTGNKVANKVLSTVASHPFATAGVVAVAANPLKAVAAGKEVVTAVKNVATKITGAGSKVAGQPAVQAAAATAAANKISTPKSVVVAAQPATQQPTTIIVPGQAISGGQYVLPPDNNAGIGQTQGSTIVPSGSSDVNQLIPAIQGKTVTNQQTYSDVGVVGQPTDVSGNVISNLLGQATGNVSAGSPTQGLSGLSSSSRNRRIASVRSQISGSITSIKKKTRKSKKKKAKKTKTSKKKGSSRKKIKAKATRKSKSLGKSKKRHFGSNKQYSKRGGKAVRYTKTGQPFIILKSGKARFIKKSGVR